MQVFKEALQLIHFTHLVSGLEDGGFAISIGRLDQLLYPYYKKDIEEKNTFRRYRYLNRGIEVVKGMGYQKALRLYMASPGRFKRLLHESTLSSKRKAL